MAHNAQIDGRMLPMPPCPACGSVEFLVRAPDNEPEHPSQGSFGHLHRMMVDQLHAELVSRDKVNAALRDPQGNVSPTLARPLSTEKRQRWFADGLRARRRVEPAVRSPEEGGQ